MVKGSEKLAVLNLNNDISVRTEVLDVEVSTKYRSVADRLIFGCKFQAGTVCHRQYSRVPRRMLGGALV